MKGGWVSLDRRDCMEIHESTRKAYQALTVGPYKNINMSFSDPRSSGRSAPLESLKVISLPELFIEHVHHGRVLYGRLVAKPFMLSAVHTVLEDKFGNRVRLSIYNAVRVMATPEEVEAKFPVGLKVAIKEPYFKWAVDGNTDVRVDNPANVVRVANHEEDGVWPDRDEARVVEFLQAIRCEGNRLFGKEDWIGAVAKYSECVDEAVRKGKSLELGGRSEKFNDVMKLTYSNRAEALLRLGKFEGALSDAERALEFDPTHVKSLFRQGRAAMEVGLYEKSCKAFESVLKQRPDDPSAVSHLMSSRICLEQSRTGDYSGKSFHLFGSTSQKYVDYVGPVEIRRISYGDGRRGLFAKQPVKACSILLVSNAMAVATAEHGGVSRLLFDTPTSSVHSSDGSRPSLCLGHEQDLVVQLLQRAATSKRIMAQLYSLASVGKEEMDVPSMELFKPGSEWVPPSAKTLEVDLNLIKEIVRVNSFGNTSRYNDLSSRYFGPAAVSGLWILPSFMNHSCVPNCNHLTIDNVKFVRATRDIGPGEELTIGYFENLFAGLEARQDKARQLTFTCRCERCFLEERLKAEFSQITNQVGVLVPASKEEFSHGRGQVLATKGCHNLADQAEAMVRSLNVNDNSECYHVSTGLAREVFQGANGKYLATRELANLADRVEALIGSAEMKIATHQQGWIRASFLEAYLAKYQLATIRQPDAGASIDTLKVIVDSMISVSTTVATLTMAHLLFHKVKGRYSKKSKTYKTTKEVVLQVIRSFLGDENSSQIWSVFNSVGPEFDYSSYCVNGAQENLDLFAKLGVKTDPSTQPTQKSAIGSR